MEKAIRAANWLLGKLTTKLCDVSLATFVASLELGHNFKDINFKLLHTQGLLDAAQGRDVRNNPALRRLLEQLSKKADEAEDVLDELHYFIIQDKLDGTQEASIQDPGPGMGAALRDHARHGRHAALYTVGNWLSSTVNDDSAVASNPHDTTNSGSDNVGGHADKLSFNRVEMSMKIKSVIEEIHALCDPISNLLDKIPNNNTAAPRTRPQRGSAIVQDKLYGREAIFHKTAHDITNCGETLSVLPIVGPGGIGKTTFTQHLYNDPSTKDRFTIRVWVCVSTDFDVLELTKQILGCIPTTEKEGSNTANETNNLSKLQESIAQRLKSKRFLIVLDDIWKCESKEDWETLLAPFTKGETKGSMVLVTTRFPKLADMMKTTNPIELQGLESNEFFTFFQACIFGEQRKPRHYEDDLIGIAREIANKLKGSPLAAKTVGRLLTKNLSWEHWNGVLQKHEWLNLNQQNNDDIMPSLKISYDYLPFDLQNFFLYCALFPEDYRFNGLEIYRFWIAIGILESSRQVDRNYLEELVDNGFLMKADDYGDQYYVMHDLMHELCRSVSAQECLNISNLDFRAEPIQPSIRHLSITIEDRYDEKFEEEMGKLKRRIDIANLRTLMIFRGYNERITQILKDMFKEIHGLRVLFIVVESIESLPHNFSKLIHLRYLKIGSPYGGNIEMALPSTLSRFYHLKFLDLEGWCGSYSLPKDFSHLVNLHDFIAKEELHSNVPKVGEMKYLRELKQFCVKKERDGFELRELGELGELGGELSIHNLENVATKGEASDAKLMLKSNMKELTLVWGGEPRSIDADVLDGLQPHPNLRALVIKNPGGTTGPSWLCRDIGLKSLETLHLEGVSWGTLPPFGQLPRLKELRLERISGLRQFGPDYGVVTGKCFLHLKEVILSSMPELVEWVVEPNSRSFPRLESIECSNCPNLRVMPLSEYSCTNLCSLEIYGCPKLSLPPMPHTSTLKHFVFEMTLSYVEDSLVVESDYTNDLAFHNMDEVEKLSIAQISLADLEKLKSLRRLNVKRCESMFSEELDGSTVFRSVESLIISDSHLTQELLSKVLSCFPELSEFEIGSKFQIDHLYEDHGEQVIQFPSSSSLQRLHIYNHWSLVLVPAEDGGGIQRNMSSLQSLRISGCGKLFSRWPRTSKRPRKARGAQNVKPFPASLRELYIDGESSLQSMALLSNLTSLTELTLVNCDNLTIDGFNPLITVNLKDLMVYNYKVDRKLPHSIAADLLSEVARSITRMPAGSFQLERLVLDSISGVLVAPICNRLAATLHTLELGFDNRTESFTEEQEKALQLLTSLQKLKFVGCTALQSLPQGLHRLSSLKKLEVRWCELRCLPKDGFPTSLQELSILYCSAGLKDQVEELKARNPNLRVRNRLAGAKLLDSIAICT